MSPAHRRLLKWSRMVHVYLTLFGMVLILFFSVTGFMLNHEDWFGLGEPRTTTREGTIPVELVRIPPNTPPPDRADDTDRPAEAAKPAPAPPVDRLLVVESLRNDFGVIGAMNSFNESPDTVEVTFRRPGLETRAEIQREDGKTVVTFDARGWIGIVTDLHKGKSAGREWGVLIDAVCVLLVIISGTGLVLWSSLKSRGKWGVVSIMLGTAAAVGVYYWWVP